MSFIKAVAIFAGLPPMLYIGQRFLHLVQKGRIRKRLVQDLMIFNTALEAFEELDEASDEQLHMLDEFLTNVAADTASLLPDSDTDDDNIDEDVFESLEDSYDRFLEFHCRICESRLNIPKARNKRPMNR